MAETPRRHPLDKAVAFAPPYLNRLLAALPAYTEVTLTLEGGRRVRLMARDLPREGRRFTNLDSGTEWFLPLHEELVAVLEAVEVPALTLAVTE